MGNPKVCKAYKTTDGWDAAAKTTNRLARVINWISKQKLGEELIKDHATIYSQYLACTKTRNRAVCWVYAHNYTVRTTLRTVAQEAIKGVDANKNCVKDDGEKIPLLKTLGLYFDRLKLNLKKAKALTERLVKTGR